MYQSLYQSLHQMYQSSEKQSRLNSILPSTWRAQQSCQPLNCITSTLGAKSNPLEEQFGCRVNEPGNVFISSLQTPPLPHSLSNTCLTFTIRRSSPPCLVGIIWGSGLYLAKDIKISILGMVRMWKRTEVQLQIGDTSLTLCNESHNLGLPLGNNLAKTLNCWIHRWRTLSQAVALGGYLVTL